MIIEHQFRKKIVPACSMFYPYEGYTVLKIQLYGILHRQQT